MKTTVIKNKLLSLDYVLLLFIAFGIISALYILFNLHIGRLLNLGNYQIFVNSFTHLVGYKNPYISFNDGLDLYKYSPTFALFMGLFYWLPNSIGIVCWHIFNLLILYMAIKDIKYIHHRLLFVLFILLTSWGSFQVSQTNAMIGGLTYLFGIYFYRGQPKAAAFILAISSFIKIYGGFAIILLVIFKENKIKFLFYYLISCIILSILPIIVINFHQLLQLYIDWWNLLLSDTKSYGLSIIGAYAKLMPIGHYGVIIINLLALIYMLGIFLRIAKANIVLSEKLLYDAISLIMLWMVIFNHKAEPQTYTLAFIGVAIWFFTNKKNSILNYVLILMVFVFALLSDTKLSSHSFKLYLLSHSIEAVVCFPVWLAIGFGILKYVSNRDLN